MTLSAVHCTTGSQMRSAPLISLFDQITPNGNTPPEKGGAVPRGLPATRLK